MPNPELSSAHSQWNLGTSIDNSELKKQTLMIVDDYQSNLDAMNALFGYQYEVVLKDNAKDAINYAIQQDVDLILLDVDMPEMNGYEACTVLKSNVMTAHIPIIFVTAADSPDEEEKGLLLGAVDYVVKPLNLSILRVRVRNHMELVHYRKKLEVLSCVDGLTGASNRRQLDTMLLQHYASTIRYGNCLALLMIDIDNFKLYNDTYGHTQGDQCLKQVAETIMSVRRRETDIVGRYGGEEFAVVLPDTDVEGGLVVANKLLKRIRDLNIKHSGNPTSKIVTVSIGLAVFEAKACDHQEISLEEFIHQADKQLYVAKHSGKNCVSQVTVNTEVSQKS
ncbi:diguanylate cyclase [Aliiglaciecola sp. LCG003]|uniref:GGDEF domain-containing response regulator n=1 Tax=Aliiglaciecola sp. LCG003 TaxID=3053655 RepID=UPI00257244BB|nr:diguanylate cyclase [Aliiglaciecola sp. LCG003]WJG09206.1 diguanylate cyclase [Aliiglaciecola sp. LCG003]